MFVNEIVTILKDELSQNNITPRQYKDYLNYLRAAADQILIYHSELHKEVTDMLTAIIPSYSEMEDQITERVTAKVTREVTALFTLKLQKKESQLSAANSENAKLRALLKTHGIDINELPETQPLS